MSLNRLGREVEFDRLSDPVGSGASSAAFIMVPAGCFQGLSVDQLIWQHSIYRMAFEQAQAAARPSLLERDLLAVWN